MSVDIRRESKIQYQQEPAQDVFRECERSAAAETYLSEEILDLYITVIASKTRAPTLCVEMHSSLVDSTSLKPATPSN
jgi:hypothetical protein